MTIVRNNSPFSGIPMSTPILLGLLAAGFVFTRWPQLTRPGFDLNDFILEFVYLIVALVIGITVHEFSHAWAALLLGDHTAESQGRVSLNPVRHLDPFGTVMVVLAGFGWGKPTPVNPSNLRIGPRAGFAIVAAAGPVSNILTAILFAVPLSLGFVNVAAGLPFGFQAVILLQYIIVLNIVLAVFNLLPIPPMDGFNFLLGVLPSRAAASVARLAPYGPIVLLGLIALPIFFPGVNPIGWVVSPIQQFLARLILPGLA